MEVLGIIGLFLGIGVLIIVSYKGFHAIPTSLLAALVVLLLNGINVWSGFSESWIGGMAVVFTNYYLLFLVSTLFANMMQTTGACETIAYKFVAWFGKKHILTVLTIFCFLLCYGGVSFFVIMFAIAPIGFSLFEELNIPRPMIIVCTAAGAGAFVLAAPGSPQIQNVIPASMGTSLMAAPILGAVMTLGGMALSVITVEYIYRREMQKVESGESQGWVSDGKIYAGNRETRPHIIGGFLPLVVVIGIIIGGSYTFRGINATMLAIIAMCVGILVTMTVNYKCIEGDKRKVFREWLSNGATGAAGPALTLGAVVGFGTVVSKTTAFSSIVKWLMTLQISTYWKGVIATGAIAGICGSASSGEQLTMQYLGEYFTQSGCNLEILHRLIANASITLDALPHATGCFLMLAYFGLNHKNGYKYVFWLDVVIPVIVVVIATILCTIIY